MEDKTEAPKSPSITQGTQRLRDPYPFAASCCKDITVSGHVLAQQGLCQTRGWPYHTPQRLLWVLRGRLLEPLCHTGAHI